MDLRLIDEQISVLQEMVDASRTESQKKECLDQLKQVKSERDELSAQIERAKKSMVTS